jgi:WD40 repeat protein/tRNA A-37 threonylcarbamoyl transferase component Bud32
MTGLELPPALAEHPRYSILRCLGSGGMGVVFLAEHRLMQRRVALKVINSGLTEQAGVAERFRREVRAAARLTHPNIVAAHDAEQAGAVHFLVMEFVEGIDLARLVQQRGPQPFALACEYVRQAALGLQHAHEHGMVHRDVKPQNLMLASRGQVKVLDLGLALFAGEIGTDATVTAAGAVLGTADYIAPEQVVDSHTVDIRSDIYSLGCTLYFLLTGRPPFPDGTLVQKLMAHSLWTPEPLSAFRADLPDGLDRVVERMMARDPAKRHSTPADVARALAPFAAASATTSTAQAADLSGAGTIDADAPTRPEFPVPLSPESQEPGVAGPTQPAPPGFRPVRRTRRLGPGIAAAVALSLLGGGLLALGVYRIQTDRGELVIETDDPDIRVIVKRGGNLVRIVDPRTNARLELRSGAYELSLPEGTKQRRLSTEALTLNRGDRPVVTVTRVPAPVPPPSAAAPVPALLAEADDVGEIARFTSPKDLVSAVAFHPDGRRVVYTTGGDNSTEPWTRGTDPALWIASVEGAKEARKLIIPELGGTSLDFLTDGRLALTGGEGGLRLWDLESERSRRVKGGPIERARCAPDGGRAAYVRGDTIFLCDLKTGDDLATCRGHGGRIWGLAFCPDGRTLVSCSPDDHTIRVWDVATGRESRRMSHGHGVNSIAVFPDGRRVLSGSFDRTIGVWDLETGQQLRRISGIADKHGAVVAVSPDGRRGLFGLLLDNSVRLWDFETGREVERLAGHTGGLMQVAFAPDGRRAVSSAFDRRVRVWSLPRERANGLVSIADIRHFVGHTGLIQEAVISPDGQRLLSGGHDRTLRLWDRESGRELRRFNQDAEVDSVAFSPDGRQALLGGNDKVVRLWDLETGRQLRTFEGHGDGIQHVAFSPHGDRILSTSGGASDASVRLWDVATRREVHRIAMPRSWFLDADFSPDGRRILAGGDGGAAVLFDVATGAEIRRLPGHPARVECVAFTPDGHRAVTGCHDNLIRLWDLETGRQLRRYRGHTGGIVWVDVSPDGRRLLSASYDDHTMILWDVETGRLIDVFPWGGVSPTRGRFTPDGRHAVWAGEHEALRLFRLPESPAAPAGPDGAGRMPLSHPAATPVGVRPVDGPNRSLPGRVLDLIDPTWADAMPRLAWGLAIIPGLVPVQILGERRPSPGGGKSFTQGADSLATESGNGLIFPKGAEMRQGKFHVEEDGDELVMGRRDRSFFMGGGSGGPASSP